MSKKTQNKSKPKVKKEIDAQLLAQFENKEPQQQPSSSKRRLKKFTQVNASEGLLPADQDDQTEKLDQQENEQYVQFHVQDDDDIKRQKAQEQAAKQSKKLKNNQKLDSFMSKQQKIDKKPSKQKIIKTQLTLHEAALLKKENKKKRKVSEDFIVGDSAQIQEQQSQGEKKRKQAQLKLVEQFNGCNEAEEKLIQKALKNSLATATSQKNFFIDYPITDQELNRKLQIPKKSLKKQEDLDKNDAKVAAKSTKNIGSKKDSKPMKQGPFAGLEIAFTGAYDEYERDAVIQACDQLGALCHKSLTKKCNLLLQGEYVLDNFGRRQKTPIQETGKSKEAVNRGIRIIDFKSLDDFFIQKTGYPIQYHLDKNKVIPNPLHSFMKKQVASDNQQNAVKIESKVQEGEQKSMNAFLVKKNQKAKQMMDIQLPVQIGLPDNRLWTQKYKPSCLDDVIGQPNQIKQLRQWLQAWRDIHINGNKRDVKEVKSWIGGGNINSKAALLSGGPGIGKTTTARLIAAQYNYLVSQFNASDVRNKSGVALLESGSYNIDAAKNLQKSLIIMDQVDGMSSGDRGGVASIIAMIKNSKIPIICVCNDRSSQKIRSLANHCLDVKFHQPNKLQVTKRLKQIIKKERGTAEDRALQQLVQSFQNDMRQILSYLQVIFKTVSTKITIDALTKRNKHAKDSSVMINHFEAARKLMNRSQFNGLKINQRVECFFVDSDMVPLMVHENILTSASKKPYDLQRLHNLVQGLKGFVVGDMLDRTIRKEQEWGLMPSYGFMSCVYTTEKISENIGYPAFPSWLGKFSAQRKQKRLAKQLKNDLFCVSLCSSWNSIKHSYSALLLQQLIELLKVQEIEGAMQLMQHYNITPLTLSQHLVSMPFSVNKSNNPLAEISSQTKAKLTRLFNKRHEDNKLKQAKAVKGKNEHVKYDPVLEMAEQQYQQAQQEAVQEKQLGGKAKTKAPKKK